MVAFLGEANATLEDAAADILPQGYNIDYTGESRQLRNEGMCIVYRRSVFATHTPNIKRRSERFTVDGVRVVLVAEGHAAAGEADRAMAPQDDRKPDLPEISSIDP